MANPQPEPSMEEILASIRRIISEDGEEEAGTPQSAPAQRARPAPQRPATHPPSPSARTGAVEEDDGAELHLRTEDVEMIKKNVAEAMQEDSEEEILDESTAAAASKAFHSLTQSVRVTTGEGRTLEAIVTDLLKPMIKEWLDANLLAIVEEKVEEEVQRVARRRR